MIIGFNGFMPRNQPIMPLRHTKEARHPWINAVHCQNHEANIDAIDATIIVLMMKLLPMIEQWQPTFTFQW
jgi:hypothetical protein